MKAACAICGELVHATTGIKNHYDEAQLLKIKPNFHFGMWPKSLGTGFAPLMPQYQGWKQLYEINNLKAPCEIE